ncbi:MAG: hydrogenase maturation nickel metallochaperone HypA [Aquabacterium sp.]
MHELSLAGGILGLVEDAARRERFARVRVLRLEAGALAGVEVHALRFALDAITPGTCLAGARIDIDEPSASAWCMDCCRSVTIESRLDPCSLCGGTRLQPTGGTSLRIVELLVDDGSVSTAESAAISSGA